MQILLKSHVKCLLSCRIAGGLRVGLACITCEGKCYKLNVSSFIKFHFLTWSQTYWTEYNLLLNQLAYNCDNLALPMCLTVRVHQLLNWIQMVSSVSGGSQRTLLPVHLNFSQPAFSKIAWGDRRGISNEDLSLYFTVTFGRKWRLLSSQCLFFCSMNNARKVFQSCQYI